MEPKVDDKPIEPKVEPKVDTSQPDDPGKVEGGDLKTDAPKPTDDGKIEPNPDSFQAFLTAFEKAQGEKKNDSKSVAEGVFALNELKDLAGTLKEERDSFEQQNNAYLEAIKARNDVDFSGLTDKERELITDFAGDDPIKQSVYFTKLYKHGMIGKRKAGAKTDQERISAGGAPKPKARTLEEAREGLEKGLQRLFG